jgi:DNA-binding MarR family transcriptional regulator
MTVALEDLGQALKRLQHRHHVTLDAKLSTLGITLVQWDALRAIDRNPDASSHQLAQITFQTDQAFGTLAGRMVERGLIERSPGTGRAILHRLTPTGETLLREGRAIVNQIFSESFACLTPAEHDLLYDLLTRLLSGFDGR